MRGVASACPCCNVSPVAAACAALGLGGALGSAHCCLGIHRCCCCTFVLASNGQASNGHTTTVAADACRPPPPVPQFFDDYDFNIDDCSPLGITCVLAPHGLTSAVWEKGLRNFAHSAALREGGAGPHKKK